MSASLRSALARRSPGILLPHRVRAQLSALVAGVLLLVPVPPVEAGGAHAHGSWAWPVSGTPTVEHLFHAPEFFYSAGHRGLDVSGSSLSITAVDDGVVTFAGPVAGKPVISIRHPGGLQSTYEPVRADVKAGDEVMRGQVIGELDPAASAFSHCAPRLCLHVGAKRGAHYLNPLPLFGAAVPSVLKPLGAASAHAGMNAAQASVAAARSAAPGAGAPGVSAGSGARSGTRVGLIHSRA